MYRAMRSSLGRGIVRNRAKIEATIANARAVLGLWKRGETLSGLFWAHAPAVGAERRPLSWADVPTQTDESRALANALKAAGFRFVGPTTAYASMQAAAWSTTTWPAAHAPSSRRRRPWSPPSASRLNIRTGPSHPSAPGPRMNP